MTLTEFFREPEVWPDADPTPCTVCGSERVWLAIAGEPLEYCLACFEEATADE